MAILKIIFVILFSPIRLIANALTQHKDNVLEWYFVYDSYLVNIQTKHKAQVLSDNLLIASYLLFLARYFYICDDRQIDIIRDVLLDYIKGFQKPSELSSKLFDVVFQTLSKAEQEATIGFFKSFSALPIPAYPLTYSDEQEPKRSYAKYSFLVFEHGGNLLANFYMSSGPDIILLPLTIGILYAYVTDKIISKDKKKILNKSIIDLLESHNSIDCRSSDGLRKLPVEIINKNNLNER